MTRAGAVVTARGATRWRHGHPWIYRSDVRTGGGPAGIVRVQDERGRYLGQALWSPRSEIRLRLLTTREAPVDRPWWTGQLRAALARRQALDPPATAYRVVHGEGDGLPSLIVDRYGPHVVAQLLSAGLEAVRDDVLGGIEEVLAPEGILLRHDAGVRRHEGLPLGIEDAAGSVPDAVDVREGDLRFLAAPRTGQKTGAFLDQRENRALVGRLARGRALDVFTGTGLFALHMARRADAVTGIDASARALELAERNRALNDLPNVHWREGNAFDELRALDEAGERFDTIVLDPPAFAKDKASVPRALRGYKEINRRALRLLAPGGRLFTASCSYHVGLPRFLTMLGHAAGDSGRRVVREALRGQAADHPEVVTIPESGYLQAALLRVE